MPPFGPIKRRDLIFFFRKFGFEGPFPRAKHQLMSKGDIDVFIPNPHEGDIGINLLNRILKQANISRSEWEKL